MSVAPETRTAAGPAPLQPRRRKLVRRLLTIALVTAALVYLAICAAIYWWQGRLIYFPSRTYAFTPADYKLPYEELTLPSASGVSIIAWYVPCDGAIATAVFCCPNGGNMGEWLGSLKTLHRLGHNVLMFDYEGYGRSGGTPSEAGTYAAADAAWVYLTQTRNEAPERVVIIGRSLGGAVAIELARRHTPAALVVESTFTSMVELGQREYSYLPVGLLCSYRYESINKVGQIPCPKLFLHGSTDELMPLDMAKRLFAAAAEPKTFIETPGGHNNSGFEYNWEYTQRLGAWLTAAQKRGHSTFSEK